MKETGSFSRRKNLRANGRSSALWRLNMPPSSAWSTGLVLDRVPAVPGGVQNTGLKVWSPPSWAGCKCGAQACRHPGRGTSAGLTAWLSCPFSAFLGAGVAAVSGGVKIRGSRSSVCKAAAAFVRKRPGLLKFAFFLPAFPYGVSQAGSSSSTVTPSHRHSPDVRCRRCGCQCVSLASPCEAQA